MSRQHMFPFVIPASSLAGLAGLAALVALAAMSACTLDQPVDGASELEQELWDENATITTYLAMGDSNVVGLGHSKCVPGQEKGTCQGFAQQTRSHLATLTPGLQALETAMIGATSVHVIQVQMPQALSFVQGKKNLFGSNVAVVLNVGGSNLLEFMTSPEFAPCVRDDFFSRVECESELGHVVSAIGADIGAILSDLRGKVGIGAKIYVVNQPNIFEANYCVEPGMEFLPEIARAALNGSTLLPFMGLNQTIALHASVQGARVIDAIPPYRAAVAEWAANGSELPSPDCIHYNDAVHAAVASAIIARL
jgi:hypothetical protein